MVDGKPPETVRALLRASGRGDLEPLVEEGVLALQQGTLFNPGPLARADRR